MRFLKKIPIHPSFLLLLAWFVISGGIEEFVIFFLVVLLHELGHYLVAKKLGYKLTGFYLAPYGVALNYKEGKFASFDEVKIALAGPLTNIAFCLICVSLWWVIPVTYVYSCDFVFFSLFLALFNLLPAYPLDGGRVLVSLLEERLSRKKALKVSMVINIVLSLFFMVMFVITCFVDYNPSLALMAFFLLVGIFESKFEGRYEQINLFKKQIKDFSTVKVVAVSEDRLLREVLSSIDKTKLTIFYVLSADGKIRVVSEKVFLRRSLQVSLNTPIKELNLK